jgi:serine protease AprX
MAELTIVFRLRFAVALAAAFCVLLAFNAVDAQATQARAEYIVQMDRGTSPAAGKRLVRSLGGRVTSPTLRVINGFGADLSRRAAARLARHPRVKAVSRNRAMAMSSTDTSGGYSCPVTDATTIAARPAPGDRDYEPSVLNAVSRLEQPFLRSIRADRAWYRATGRGVGVAVIDTGIAGDVPDFQSTRGSRVIASAVTNPCARDANDHYGHGTHIAGLIAGNSLVFPNWHWAYGKYMGVAPRANLVSVKVSDDDGNTTVLDVIYGIQFAVDRRADYGIRVINLSLSSTVAESYRTDPLDAAVESAWFRGLVVVTAAGNEGTSGNAVSFAPANDPWVISAGAVDDRSTLTRLDDALAPWSSRGWTQDGVRKPEVLAPGVRLVSTLAPNSDFRAPLPRVHRGLRALLQGGRDLDVRGARVRRGGASPRGAPQLDAGARQGRPGSDPRRRAGCRRRGRCRRRAGRDRPGGGESGAERAGQPGDGRDRLGARQLPAGELPRRERLAALRVLGPGQLPLRLQPHRQRRDRADTRELPQGQLPQNTRLRQVGRW